MAIIRSDRGEHQHIHGLVNADGMKESGEDFFSEQVGRGTYRVMFDMLFGERPSVVCTPWQSHGEHVSMALPHIAETHFECVVTDGDGERVDSGFSFIAFGAAR